MADKELIKRIRSWNGSTPLGEKKLTGADLSSADLIGADLTGADLRDANLWKTNCTHANLEAAHCVEADLRGTNFYQANLSGVSLTQAVLGNTLFVDCCMNNVIGLESAVHYSGSAVDHQTIQKSGYLPDVFLKGCGLPDSLIEYFPSLINQPISFYSCFISYSHADKSFARRLHDGLQGRGIRCWLDEHQLLPGDDIFKEVDRGLRLWDKVLLCASESSLKSWWVDNEMNSAFKKEQRLMKDRSEKVYALIPLNLDGAIFQDDWGDGKAEQIRSRLAADFTGWETNNSKFENAFEGVVKALTEDGRETPPVPKL